MKNKTHLIIGAFAFILLIVFLSLLLGDKFQVTSCGCPNVVSQYFIYIFITLAIVFIYCLLHYLFSLKIDAKQCVISKNMEILYAILDNDERSTLDELVKNNGELDQSDLSKKYNKLKAHRIIKKLLDKGLIDITKSGKTNKIKLKSELARELVK